MALFVVIITQIDQKDSNTSANERLRLRTTESLSVMKWEK